MREMVPSGGQSRVENRINWAITSLKKAGLINNPKRGQWEITQEGRDYLTKHKGIIKLVDLEKMWSKINNSSVPSVTPGTITPDEQMTKSYEQHHQQLLDEILDYIKDIPASDFERLVVRLLSKMDYGEGERVGKSGDQGIDGVLDKDALGLEKVYVQAKRYNNYTVGSPEIRTFAGSLDAKGATKGVFITNSTFSKVAIENTKNISFGNKYIRLIDGEEMAKLMIKYDVGVVTETTYHIKKLDKNIFDSNTQA